MMLTFMQETCNKNIDLLDNFAENGQSFELREIFGKFTVDTIASPSFNTKGTVPILRKHF